MRPNGGFEGTSSLSRKSSNDPQSIPSSHPASFFLARESDLVRTVSNTSTSLTQESSPVKTLKETIEERNRRSSITSKNASQSGRSVSRRRSTIKPRSIEELRQEALCQPSGPTPPSIVPTQEPSLPSSPKSISSRSFQKSDDELTQDESGSQVIASSESEGGDDEQSQSIQDSAPQLIMPSIRMPSRRPFTPRGKQLGRFKLMVAGSKGNFSCLHHWVKSSNLASLRVWKNISVQVYCPALRRYRSCRSNSQHSASATERVIASYFNHI